VLGASRNELEATGVDEDRLATGDSQAESYAVLAGNFDPPDHLFWEDDEEEFEIEFGDNSMPPSNDEEQPGRQKPSYSTSIGRIVAHSGQSMPSEQGNCNQDWALIELNKVQSSVGNYLIDASFDPALFPLQLTEVAEQKTLLVEGERLVGVKRTAPSPSWGVLSRTLSFIMISPGNTFTETYSLTLASQSGE
jgi:hypothetical protein